MYEPGAGLGGRGLGARAGGLGRGLLGGRGLGGGDVEDVQDATGGWLGGGVFSWIVGDVVAVDDVLSHLLTSITQKVPNQSENSLLFAMNLAQGEYLRSTSSAVPAGAWNLGT